MVEKQGLVGRAFWGALILLLAVSFAFSESEQGWAQSASTMIPLEDLDRAYVRSDKPNENYGGGNLHAKYELKVERSFIKYDFDVGDEDTGNIRLGDGDTVILHLDAKNIDGVALVGVYGVFFGWDEDSITWANAPDSFWVYYGTLSGSGDVDVTDAVDDQGILNLGLKIDAESGYIEEYIEWDNAYLTIETGGGQVPFEDLDRAYVSSDTPNENHGGGTLHAKYELKVERSFVKYDFDVGDENTGSIRLGDGDTVILHLDAENIDGVALVGVYGVSSNWEEDNITWATNAPDSFWACYGMLSGSGDVDVTDAVDDQGILSLGLKINVESGYINGCIEWYNAYLHGDYSPAADVVTRAYAMITSPQDGLFTEESKRIVTYELLGENLSQAILLHNGEETDIAAEGGSITITLIPGENVFEVRATNASGNTASSEQVTVMFVPRMEATITYPPAMAFAGEGLVTVPSVEVRGIVVSYPAVTEVTIILNDEDRIIAEVDGGYFEYTITTLEESLNTIRVKVADIWGDTASSGIVGVIYDPEKLTVEVLSPADGEMTNAKICVVSGTITHGRAVTQALLYVNGVGTPMITLTKEADSYTYSFTKEITLREGENTFAVEGTDEIGDSGSSGTMFITLDSTPPQVEIITPASNYLTNTTTVLVSGRVDDPAVSEVTVEVNDTGQMIAVVEGSFSGEVVLIEGTNTIEALALDPLGNKGSSQPVVVTYNSAAPTVSITSPVGGTRTNSDTVSVNYTIAGNVTSAQFILNGDSEGILRETGSTTVSLAEGENTIELQVSNQTITASSGVVTVVSDTTPPSISADVSEPWEEVLISVYADEQLSSPPMVTVTGTDTTEVDMALSGVRQWSGTYEIPADGNYLVEVQGTDEAGNAGSCTLSFSRNKETVSAFAGETITVESNRLTVKIKVDKEVKDQSISTVLRYEDPRLGRVAKPAIFVRVKMGVPLRWAMTSMTIRATYDPAELQLPEGMNETAIRLYLWTPSKGGYVPVQGAIVNTVTHSIIGTVTY